MDRKDQIMMDAADKCLEALDAADRAGDAIQTIEPREPRIALHEFYSYWRMDADAAGADPDHAPEDELTRAELLERLDGHVIDPAMAVADLEANAGVWTRLTSFAFYRAVYESPTDDDQADDSADDQADDQADDAGWIKPRIVRQFPIYLQYLLARGIHNRNGEIFPFVDEYGHLNQFNDDELASFALDLASALPSSLVTTPESTSRKRAYLRILGTALRHFQDNPPAVAASVLLVKMIAKGGRKK